MYNMVYICINTMRYMVLNKKERVNIRNVLQNARKSKNLTQANVAKCLGMETNSYQRIELGINGTSEENWIKLFNLFNKKTPLEQLMENVKTTNTPSTPIEGVQLNKTN